MQYPITATIILVQTTEDAEVRAYVDYGPSKDRPHRTHVELNIGTLPDAVDMQMWMQMAAASVCDGL